MNPIKRMTKGKEDELHRGLAVMHFPGDSQECGIDDGSGAKDHEWCLRGLLHQRVRSVAYERGTNRARDDGANESDNAKQAYGTLGLAACDLGPKEDGPPREVEDAADGQDEVARTYLFE